MPLSQPPLDRDPETLADWFEFRALISEFQSTNLNDLVRISDEDQDFENENFLEQDNYNEELLNKVTSEISLRIDTLQDAYPFSLVDDSTELLLDSEILPGGYVYLYCLFFSHVNNSDVLSGQVLPPSDNASRDLMQICATLCAAGELQGSAVSFGWPRPDSSGFLNKTRSVYSVMGEGSVRDELLPGVSPYTKDGGIDVIAWQERPDNAPGKKYLIGQVATGADWDTKSVMLDMETFHEECFTEMPVSTPTPAMFMPFCIEGKWGATRDQRINYYTRRLGNIFYRYRLPNLAQKGFDLAQSENDFIIERADEFDRVIDWVSTFREQLRMAASA